LPGDTVLLAPAAASMDQFIDYSDRGRRFAQAVKDLLDKAPLLEEAPGGDYSGDNLV
jgi:UDP-N-acetylmuramoylalanine--D-glutamate ligase